MPTLHMQAWMGARTHERKYAVIQISLPIRVRRIDRSVGLGVHAAYGHLAQKEEKKTVFLDKMLVLLH